MILSLVNELAYNGYIYVFSFLIRNRLDIAYYFWEIILPETIFTVVATLLLYRSVLFTNRRLAEMEKRRD